MLFLEEPWRSGCVDVLQADGSDASAHVSLQLVSSLLYFLLCFLVEFLSVALGFVHTLGVQPL